MYVIPILSNIVSITLLKSLDKYCFRPNKLNESSINAFSMLQKNMFPFKLQNHAIQLSSATDDSSSSSLPFSSDDPSKPMIYTFIQQTKNKKIHPILFLNDSRDQLLLHFHWRSLENESRFLSAQQIIDSTSSSSPTSLMKTTLWCQIWQGNPTYLWWRDKRIKLLISDDCESLQLNLQILLQYFRSIFLGEELLHQIWEIARAHII